jgi:hypothetical protein
MSGAGNSVSESTGSPIFVKSTLMLESEGYSQQSDESHVSGAPLKVLP